MSREWHPVYLVLKLRSKKTFEIPKNVGEVMDMGAISKLMQWNRRTDHELPCCYAMVAKVAALGIIFSAVGQGALGYDGRVG